MKTKYQAWGWLAAGVLAAGLNASYYDGGLQRAHQIANRVAESSAAVLALFTGQAHQFLAEARLLSPRDQTSSSPLVTTIAKLENGVKDEVSPRPSNCSPRAKEFSQLMAARQAAQFERLQAHRARLNEQIAARTAKFQMTAVAFAPLIFKIHLVPATCSRIRVNVPQMPAIQMPAVPTLHLETSSAGPI